MSTDCFVPAWRWWVFVFFHDKAQQWKLILTARTEERYCIFITVPSWFRQFQYRDQALLCKDNFFNSVFFVCFSFLFSVFVFGSFCILLFLFFALPITVPACRVKRHHPSWKCALSEKAIDLYIQIQNFYPILNLYSLSDFAFIWLCSTGLIAPKLAWVFKVSHVEKK